MEPREATIASRGRLIIDHDWRTCRDSNIQVFNTHQHSTAQNMSSVESSGSSLREFVASIDPTIEDAIVDEAMTIFEQNGFKWSVVMKREVMCENQVVLKLTKFGQKKN